MLVAAYMEKHPGSPQTIKQHLAAIKMLFDYLVISQIVPTNPAAPVKGPTDVVKRGKTPVLSVEDARTFLDSIPTDSLQGLRDRALIGVMLFSFARGFGRAKLAPALGPTLGGWITDNSTWRWIFFINIPVGFLSRGWESQVTSAVKDLTGIEARGIAEFACDHAAAFGKR